MLNFNMIGFEVREGFLKIRLEMAKKKKESEERYEHKRRKS